MLGRAIGEALAACSVPIEAAAQPFGANMEKYQDGTRDRTHLHEAIIYRERCDSGYGSMGLDADGIEDFVSERDACSRAWVFVKARKAARKELGAARRAIRAIGRAELNRRAGV